MHMHTCTRRGAGQKKVMGCVPHMSSIVVSPGSSARDATN